MPPKHPITKDTPRVPISDFVRLIEEEKEGDAKPTKFVLNFRDWQSSNHEVDVYKIRTAYLRFRKDNGRIASDVDSYEMLEAPLEESTEQTQTMLGEFLLNKSPDRITQLMNLLRHSGQKEPAIITCDGFLVNGNRRKLALERLYQETKDERFLRMKVVILPSDAKPKEIEQVENRYQYHSDGKEEYTHFDKALSIRRKEKNGISLEEQLVDDPEYHSLPAREQKKRIETVRIDLLGTLDCIDAYLEHFDRKGVYSSVAAGPGDKEGRWEAFLSLNKSVYSKLPKPADRLALNIEESEIGRVTDVAFKLIRKRELGDGRLNDIVRSLPRIFRDSAAKKELLKLADEEMQLTTEEITRENRVVDEREQDRIWSGKFGTGIIRQVTKAKAIVDAQSVLEKPIDILEAALCKLRHKDLDLGDISAFEIDKAMEIVKNIQGEADTIHEQLDKHRYAFKQLAKRKPGRND